MGIWWLKTASRCRYWPVVQISLYLWTLTVAHVILRAITAPSAGTLRSRRRLSSSLGWRRISRTCAGRIWPLINGTNVAPFINLLWVGHGGGFPGPVQAGFDRLTVQIRAIFLILTVQIGPLFRPFNGIDDCFDYGFRGIFATLGLHSLVRY
jgi:hypothetical protein